MLFIHILIGNGPLANFRAHHHFGPRGSLHCQLVLGQRDMLNKRHYRGLEVGNEQVIKVMECLIRKKVGIDVVEFVFLFTFIPCRDTTATQK